MPRLSDRARLLRDLENSIQTLMPIYCALIGLKLTEIRLDYSTLLLPPPSTASHTLTTPDFLQDLLYGPTGLGTVLQMLTTSWQIVSGSRYLDRDDLRFRIKQRGEYMEEILSLNDRRFKTHARMNHQSFNTLVNLIRDDPVFSNSSHRQQEPVEYQLLVMLDRMGSFGNGGSVGHLRSTYAAAEGTVQLWTWRCIDAIMNLGHLYLVWPDAEERIALQAQAGRVSSFANCVGFVDGTHLRLYQRPGVPDASDYYTKRRRDYTINVMGVADIDKRLRFLDVGWAGSQHDQRIFDATPIHQYPYTLFSEGQYLLADAGYLPTRFTVPVYKSPANGHLTQDQRTFNRHVSNLRVKVEHAFGMWKMRFMSLKGLRLGMNCDWDIARICRWIVASAVLHNFLFDEEGDDFWAGENMERLQARWEREAREEREAYALDANDAQEIADYGGRGDNSTRVRVKRAGEARGYGIAYA